MFVESSGVRIADGVRANGVGAEYPTAAIAGGFMRVWVSLATAKLGMLRAVIKLTEQTEQELLTSV